MYNNTSIQALVDRIGWAQSISPDPSITVDSDNLTANSGRYFNSFHQLATAENVKACISNMDATDATVNAYLMKMKRDNVLEVLNKVFDVNPLAYSATQQIDGKIVTSTGYSAAGYDTAIANHTSLFDNAIGYAGAIRALELFITTKRSNEESVDIDMTADQMRLEVEGLFDVNGKQVSGGLKWKYYAAIKAIVAILFPTKTSSLATLTGKHPW